MFVWQCFIKTWHQGVRIRFDWFERNWIMNAFALKICAEFCETRFYPISYVIVSTCALWTFWLYSQVIFILLCDPHPTPPADISTPLMRALPQRLRRLPRKKERRKRRRGRRKGQRSPKRPKVRRPGDICPKLCYRYFFLNSSPNLLSCNLSQHNFVLIFSQSVPSLPLYTVALVLSRMSCVGCAEGAVCIVVIWDFMLEWMFATVLPWNSGCGPKGGEGGSAGGREGKRWARERNSLWG
jgi:hypothetical protein